MTEREFQRMVIQLAHICGWRVAHFRPAQTKHGWRTPVGADGQGFVDLVLVHPAGFIIFAEVKTDVGRLTDDQRKWGATFDDCVARLGDPRIRYEVWRPRDWGRVVDILQEPRPHR